MEKVACILYLNSQILGVGEWYTYRFFSKVASVYIRGIHFSSFLFVIVMKALSRLITSVVFEGYFKGFTVDNWSNETMIYYLLFMVETLIFCEANSTQIRYLGASLLVLRRFWGLALIWASLR